MLRLLLLLLGAIGAYSSPRPDTARADETCGYESCPKTTAGVINVHIVPHTHDDVGWLKTVDQYYYGSRNNIQKAGVQYILDSVIKELWEDPKRRFIYVETAFFWKWWVRQSDAVQQKVHTLVRQGRLQFVGGAWSMNDEAASHYQSTIDQFTWGLSKLNKTFGYCGLPRVGWQIDPFGHSREFASLLSMMGYDGLFLGRIDYQDKSQRLANKAMEIVWRGDDNLGKQSDIFTGVLHNTYSPPPGFCFDVLCSDEPIIDDPDSPMYNVEQKINTFLELCSKYSTHYQTNNILITMGEDFNYQDAAMWFTNLDKLIQSQLLGKYFHLTENRSQVIPPSDGVAFLRVAIFLDYVKNQARHYRTNNVIITMGGDFTYQDAAMWYFNLDKLIQYTNLISAKNNLPYKLFYSTPNCYLKAIKEANPQLPTKTDDFFPYASDPNAYWTGYFTSRPTTKFFEREANNYLQMVKQLQVLANLDEHNQFVLDELKSAMGVMQHHDAITGTEKQHVTHDYERLLNQAVDDALIIAKQALNKLSQKVNTTKPILDFQRCHLNESRCIVSETSDQFVVTVYNPLGWAVKEPIRIPVPNESYTVFAPNGKEIKTQSVPLPNSITNIPTRESKATKEIVFIAYVKPLGYKSFYIKKNKRAKRDTNFEYLTDINEYFENIKDKMDDEILKKEKDSALRNDIRIPFAPVSIPNIEVKDIDLGLLKDGTNNKEFNELEKFLKEQKDRGVYRQTKSRIETPKLSDEEMRMLSDEPRVVERFEDFVDLENEFFKMKVDKAYGEVKHISFPNGSQLNFTINMYYYPGTKGRNIDHTDRASGAYIFRPNATSPTKLNMVKSDVISGDIVQEFRVQLYPAGYINTKIYKELDFIENEFVVGPIPIDDDLGKEYIVKYETNILNNGEFYTDSNGRQILKRKLNFRPQWNVSLAEPVAGNYFPVTNEIFIKDEDIKLSILTDRSEGGSSLIEGEIELMVHRRLLWDDAFGVGEPLNETAKGQGLVVRGKHRILIKKPTDNINKDVLQLHLSPNVLVSDAKNLDLNDWLNLNKCGSFLNKGLPDGLHLLTIEPWDGKILLRLENYLENDSDLEVDLKVLFTNININNVKETMLGANIWIEDYEKWVWNGDTETEVKNDDGFKIKLKSKEIRTFIVDYEFKG